MLTQKEAIRIAIEETSDSLAKNKLLERYWKRLVSGGEKKYQQQLGNIQNNVREQERYLQFLAEVLKECEAG